MSNRWAYFNENKPEAVEWLRELIKRGIIAKGEVDARSIVHVAPEDLRGFTQHHFFAGIGVWSYAARLAGFPDERAIWTASCPCQPFSVAGQGKGSADPRHLWPNFFRLVCAVRPALVMGEQVAGKAGLNWIDGVLSDLESETYAARSICVASCSVNAPHIRRRLYWGALADSNVRGGRDTQEPDWADWQLRSEPQRDHARKSFEMDGESGVKRDRRALVDSPMDGQFGGDGLEADAGQATLANAADSSLSFWRDYEWRVGHGNRIRRAKPGARMLVDGSTVNPSMWAGIGNAVNAILTAEVISAFLDSEHESQRTSAPPIVSRIGDAMKRNAQARHVLRETLNALF